MASEKTVTINNQTIINGDCLKVMRSMEAGFFDACVASPPYNIGCEYNSYKDKKTRDDYIEWIAAVTMEIRRILSPNGSFFLVLAGKVSEPSLPFDVMLALRRIMSWQNHIIWTKSICIGNDPSLSFGHYKPVNSMCHEHGCFENVFHLTNSGNVECDRLAIGVPYKWKCNRKNRKTGVIKPDIRPRGNCWFVPYRTIQMQGERFHHPATFPVELVEMCLKFHGVGRIRRVIDPFCGIGSTLAACCNLGLAGTGIDLDKKYCHDAAKLVESMETVA